MSSSNKSVKPPKVFPYFEKKNKIQSLFLNLQKLLFKKYSNKEYNYININTNHLIFNEKSRIVSIFKDYLIFDDSTEFLNKFYPNTEIKERLKKIYNFYSTYSKIFPNYIILSENLYLYRNIRKKQKMIDAFNEIKKEEEENRKNLQLGLSSTKKISNYLQIFDKSTQESINRYQPSIISTLLTNTFKNSLDESKSTISISLYNKTNLILNNNNINQNESFKDDNNTTLNSFESIVSKLENKRNKKITKLLKKELISTPKRENSNNKKSQYNQQSALNNNKTFLSHKTTVSLDKNQNLIKKLITEKKIKNIHDLNIFNYNEKNASPHIKSHREKKNILNSFSSKPETRKNSSQKSKKKKSNTNYFIKEIHTSEYKSPISKDLNLTNKNIKRPITTTIKTINHMMPFYKNKIVECEKNSINDVSDSMNNFSSFTQKVNPLKIKLEKKKNSIMKKHNALNSFGNVNFNKKSFIASFTLNNPKEIKKKLFTDGNKSKKNDSNQYSNTNHKDSSTTINTGNENNNKQKHRNKNNSQGKSKNHNTKCYHSNNFNSNIFNSNNFNIKIIKNKYKNTVEKNKIVRNSYDPQSNFFHKYHTHNSLSDNNKNKNMNLKSQRKIKNTKSSIDKKNNIVSSTIRIPLTALQNKFLNFNNNNNNNNVCTPVIKTLKLNLNLKDKKNNKNSKTNKNIIKKINFKAIDTNTKKMKFIKK